MTFIQIESGSVVEASLADLQARRAQLYSDLAQTADFRRGTLTATYRRCGKANCACADLAHPGHGPRHLLTRSESGKTVARQLAPGPELNKVSREVANYQHFRALVGQVTEVNDAICDARPVSPLAEDAPTSVEAEKGGSSASSRRSSRPR